LLEKNRSLCNAFSLEKNSDFKKSP
jgi:hypothetical protein